MSLPVCIANLTTKELFWLDGKEEEDIDVYDYMHNNCHCEFITFTDCDEDYDDYLRGEGVTKGFKNLLEK